MGKLPPLRGGGELSAVLEADHLTRVFSRGLFNKVENVAVNDISLRVDDENPSITVIAGESGSGKTTLASMLLGFMRPTRGEIRYLGREIYSLKGNDWREYRRNVQPIFQDPFEVFNPVYRVDRILTQPAQLYGIAESEDEAREMVEDALRQVGLRPAETLGRFPHQLSGGQRQRITVARAFLLKPKVIVADEPVSMIDASLRATVLESLRELKTELGISIIYITHDLTTAYQVGDTIYVLYRGSVVEAGNVEHVVQEPSHPYTQLLMGSIPVPDPRVPWGENLAPITARDEREEIVEGCAFAPRCPHAFDRCANDPPHFRLEDDRAVKCFLHEDRPITNLDSLINGTVNAPN